MPKQNTDASKGEGLEPDYYSSSSTHAKNPKNNSNDNRNNKIINKKLKFNNNKSNSKQQKSKIILKERLQRIWLLFLGRTKKQRRLKKPSFVGRQMSILFLLFIFYSFVFFIWMNPDLVQIPLILNILNVVTIGSPYYFAISITLTFLELALLFSNDKILKFIFSNHSVLKQFLLFLGLVFLNFLITVELNRFNFDQYAILLVFASIWMLFQGIRLYTGSRNFAAKLEARWTEHYSSIRTFLAIILPFLLLGVLVVVAWSFRYVLVIFTLDYLAHKVPDLAIEVYKLEMQLVMPMIYVGLIAVFLFVIVQLNLARKSSSTAQSAIFDTLSFTLITFVMFFYALYNVALFLFSNNIMIEAIQSALGGTASQSSSSTLFFIEFLITLIFLVWIIVDLKNTFQTGFLFFSTDGLVFFIIGTIMAQTASRVGLISGAAGEISAFASIITYDYLILPFFIILFLGFTLVMYWIKPQETSMFIHSSKAVVGREDKAMDTILKFLKREFIRRSQPYLLDESIIEQIQTITSLPRGVIWSLIHRLNEQFVDFQLKEIENKNNEKSSPLTRKKNREIKFIVDFIPITAKYQRDSQAEKKAQSFMLQSFMDNIYKKQRKKINLARKQKLTSSKQSDMFVQALSVQYGRKIRDEEALKHSREEEEFIIETAIDQQTVDLVYELIKNEYIKRIKEQSDYPDFRFQISEIASTVEKATRITPGRLYPLLNKMANDNWNFNLSANFEDSDISPIDKDDRLIEFLPIDDCEIYQALKKYRPYATKEIDILMQTWFDRNINASIEKKELKHLPPLEYDNADLEFQRSYRSKWFAKTMRYFNKNFKEVLQNRLENKDYSELIKLFDQIKSSAKKMKKK